MSDGLFAENVVSVARDALFRLGGVPVVVDGKMVAGVVTERPIYGEHGAVDYSARMRVVSIRRRDVSLVRLDSQILIDGRPHRVISSVPGPDGCLEITIVEEDS